MEIERQRLLDEAALRDATRLRIGDDGAGVGAFPLDSSATQGFAQNLAHSAIVPAGFSLPLEASQTLAENGEYQQLLQDTNALSSGLLASAPNPPLIPIDVRGPTSEEMIRNVPAPGGETFSTRG